MYAKAGANIRICFFVFVRSIVRWNLKEAVGKSLDRRIEITYKASPCVAGRWKERARTLDVEISQRYH